MPLMDKQVVLIVDDSPDNLDVLTHVLRAEYKVVASLNGSQALDLATNHIRPDIILLDILMPEMDGFEVCKQLKSNPQTRSIPVIFISASTEIRTEEMGFDVGAIDYISKPFSPSIVRARVKTHLALADQNRALHVKVKQRTGELQQTRLEIIRKLGRAAEYRDNETGMHVIRMSHYSRMLAKEYGGDDEWIETLFNAAPMHDVGKIGIPDQILLKPGKLDAQEWDIMCRHAEIGAEIIGDEDNPLLKMSKEIALCHHEKWDGNGYPRGLAGEEIPIEARIVAIADVFDALTSVRPYKEAWPIEKAVDFILSQSGKHFDPKLIAIFETLIDDFKEIMARYAD